MRVDQWATIFRHDITFKKHDSIGNLGELAEGTTGKKILVFFKD